MCTCTILIFVSLLFRRPVSGVAGLCLVPRGCSVIWSRTDPWADPKQATLVVSPQIQPLHGYVISELPSISVGCPLCNPDWSWMIAVCCVLASNGRFYGEWEVTTLLVVRLMTPGFHASKFDFLSILSMQPDFEIQFVSILLVQLSNVTNF